MKDGLRFVDCDMHIMEPRDLFDRYLDPRFKHRVSVLVGADGGPRRGAGGAIVVEGIPTTDADLQQYRKRPRVGPTQSSQPLSGSWLADTGRLDFAIERNYNAEAQVMAMAMEGVDIAVLYPTSGLSLITRDNLDPGYRSPSARGRPHRHGPSPRHGGPQRVDAGRSPRRSADRGTPVWRPHLHRLRAPARARVPGVRPAPGFE